MASGSSENCLDKCCSMLINLSLLWVPYYCFKTSAWTGKLIITSPEEECSLQVFSFEHWKISILSIAQLLCRIPCRGSIPRGVIPHQEANERPQHSPLLSVQEAAEGHPRTVSSTAARLCLQDVPGFPNQCSLCPSPVAVLQLPAWGSLSPHLCCDWAGFGCIPSWQPGARHSIATTVLWSVGGWFSLVFLGVLSFPLIYHVIHC